MSIKLKLAIFFGWLLLAVAALAQIGSGVPKAPSVVVAPIEPVTLGRGGSAPVELNFRVPQGYHINSNQPHGEFLLPTSLKMDPPSDIIISRVTYPDGQDQTFPFAPEEKLNVYTGDFRVTAMVRTTSTIPAGTYRVRGTLTYQACDNAACYPPKKLPLDFDVRVGKKPGGKRNPGQSPHVH